MKNNLKDNSVNLNDTLTKVCCVIYEESEVSRFVELCESKGLKYAYIKHFPEEEDKKEHYHFVVFSNSRLRFRIIKFVSELTPINLFEKLNNVNCYLRYMTHIDYVDKQQYEVENIISNVNDVKSRILSVEVDPKELKKQDKKLVFKYAITIAHNITDVVKFCFDNDIEYNSSWTFTLKELIKENWQYRLHTRESIENDVAVDDIVAETVQFVIK